MNILKAKRFKDAEVKVGNVLLAKPVWQEECYKRSVILLVDISPEGCAGIILNKESNLSVHDALPEINHYKPLYFGGSANLKTVSYVHNIGALKNTYPMGEKLFWGGDYEDLKERDRGGQIDWNSFRFYSGFVHWYPEQIQQEINKGKWWVGELSARDFYKSTPENLWSTLLVSQGHPYGLLNLHPDPSMN